jgi:hypothetical protein
MKGGNAGKSLKVESNNTVILQVTQLETTAVTLPCTCSLHVEDIATHGFDRCEVHFLISHRKESEEFATNVREPLRLDCMVLSAGMIPLPTTTFDWLKQNKLLYLLLLYQENQFYCRK